MKKYHIFGDNKQWALSVDDRCIQFHPQFNEFPEKTSKWLWKEAYDEIEKLGGHKAVVKMLVEGTFEPCKIIKDNDIKQGIDSIQDTGIVDVHGKAIKTHDKVKILDKFNFDENYPDTYTVKYIVYDNGPMIGAIVLVSDDEKYCIWRWTKLEIIV